MNPIATKLRELHESQQRSRSRMLKALGMWEAKVRELLTGLPFSVIHESTGFAVYEDGKPISVFNARVSTIHTYGHAHIHTSPISVVEPDFSMLDDTMEDLLAFRFGKYIQADTASNGNPPDEDIEEM